MLSEEELQELRDLVKNASPGPWEPAAYGLHMDGSAQYRIGPRGRPGGVYFQGWHPDAQFIAACRMMVPELLGHVAALEEKLQVVLGAVARVDAVHRERGEKLDAWLREAHATEAAVPVGFEGTVEFNENLDIEGLLTLMCPDWRELLLLLEGLRQMQAGEGRRWHERPDGTWGPVEDR